ncbi:hypothetical protein MFMK1_001492 [Metallumcola ferriviriculae]|uniref:NADH dehydrogenase subunit 6 n=1 Tax=Metallumcola ferriviriculae TaxID=3039180 RepID=A0AAU0UNC7_9FIRM|nr:hypothetical protein MFMK1_001492 [Desulfitibacteraceae bacterium MK1]
MNEMSVIFRILIGDFLILHGLVLPIMALVPSDKVEGAPVGSFWAESWLFGTGMGVKFAIYGLSAVSAVLFILSGMSFMGLLVPYRAFNTLLLAGASVSLVLITVFWLPWFIIGIALNLLILIVAV